MELKKKKRYFYGLLNINSTQIIVMGFAAVILIGSILLNLPVASRSGESVGYVNALFTATSAVCVTGLVVVDTYTHWTLFGQVVILTLIQIGGLGFMTVATLFSFVLRRRIGLKERLIIVESLNQYNLQGVVRLTKRILIATFILEGIGAVILSLRFIPDFGVANGIYKGIFHAVSAFCNAGFDLMGQVGEYSSLTFYGNDIIVNLVVIFLVVLGGLGFAVLDDLYKSRSFKKLCLHSKLVLTMTGILLAFGFIFFFAVEFNNPDTLGSLSLKNKFFAALFQSVTPRTAGFNTIDQPSLRSASVFITILLMFIGGSPGSTAGGIKTTTLGVLFLTVLGVIKGKGEAEVFKKRLNNAISLRALSIMFMSAILVAVTTIILSISESASLIEVLFESVSAFGTVGLSLGITPNLGLISKATLIVTMFMGRVGVLTMALALASNLQKDYTSYKYPEDKVAVG